MSGGHFTEMGRRNFEDGREVALRVLAREKMSPYRCLRCGKDHWIVDGDVVAHFVGFVWRDVNNRIRLHPAKRDRGDVHAIFIGFA